MFKTVSLLAAGALVTVQCAVALLAQAQSSGGLDWIAPFTQLVTAGGFGALVWYFVVRHIPSIEQRHLTERNELEERHHRERMEWRVYLETRDKLVDDVITELRNEHG